MGANQSDLGLVDASLSEEIINALCAPIYHLIFALGVAISISIFKLHSTPTQNILLLFYGKRKSRLSNYFLPK